MPGDGRRFIHAPCSAAVGVLPFRPKQPSDCRCHEHLGAEYKTILQRRADAIEAHFPAEVEHTVNPVLPFQIGRTLQLVGCQQEGHRLRASGRLHFNEFFVPVVIEGSNVVSESVAAIPRRPLDVLRQISAADLVQMANFQETYEFLPLLAQVTVGGVRHRPILLACRGPLLSRLILRGAFRGGTSISSRRTAEASGG